MKPGIHHLPADQYHALHDCLSAGIARELVEHSPAHARVAMLAQDDPSKASERGTIGHDLLLEGVNRVQVIDPERYPAKNGNIPLGWTNTAIRAARDDARASGKIPLLKADYEPVLSMVEAAKRAWDRCPDLEGYRQADGQPELSLVWDEDGTLCRCRPDWWSADRALKIDWKFSSLVSSPESFQRQFESQGYDLRAAHYLQGAEVLTGKECKYVYAVQETDPPYATKFIGVSPAMRALGEAKRLRALAIWSECMKSGEWPAYDLRIHWLEPEPWQETKWMEREAAAIGREGFPYNPDELYKGARDGR